MNETERETHRYMTALQGETPHTNGTQSMRRVSLESLSVLQLVGSPFAPVFNAALNGEQAEPPKVSAVDVAVFAWAHSAPADEVLTTALQCAPDYTAPAVRAALQHIRSWKPDEVATVVQYAMRDAQAVTATAFDAESPFAGGGKKKS